jgi:YgiT-type zinc finger domain-containing protein
MEEKKMRCAICKHGETAPGVATVTLQRDGAVIVIKNVPADICENCGEYYLAEEIADRVYAQGEEALSRHAEVEVVRFAA